MQYKREADDSLHSVELIHLTLHAQDRLQLAYRFLFKAKQRYLRDARPPTDKGRLTNSRDRNLKTESKPNATLRLYSTDKGSCIH